MFVVTIVTNQICYRYFSFVILTKVFLSVAHGIEKLEKRWNDCIAAEGDYVDE